MQIAARIAVVGIIVNDYLNSGIMEITWLRHFNHTKPVWFVAKNTGSNGWIMFYGYFVSPRMTGSSF